jgi:hypothetical protein
MDDDSTYNIRVYRTEVYKGARVTTYRVRWRAGHRLWREASATQRWLTASVAPC